MYSPAIIFTLLSTLAHSALAATDTYRIYAVPKGPLTTFRTQVSFVNSSAFIGNIKFHQSAEPLIIYPPSPDKGIVSFLSYHTDRYLNFYVYPNSTAANPQPLGLTTWQGVPTGATTQEFEIGDDGLLRWDGVNGWIVCPVVAPLPDTYRVGFVSTETGDVEGCVRTDLKVQGYGTCV